MTTPESTSARPLVLGRFRFDGSRPLIMGIVNLTPDSFAGSGREPDADEAIAQARQMMRDGADIIDLGAESTRPGAPGRTPADELARLLPVIEALVTDNVALSVDTRHATTMREVLRWPVDLINDVNGLRDPGALAAVAASGAGVCVMHMQGTPGTMQQAPRYDDVADEVGAFLAARVRALAGQGVPAERILVDPGIGFGKNLAHNIALLKAVRPLAARCGCPVLIGLSRKSILGEITGKAVDQRLAASLGGALAAIVNGARVVRVHDVAATRDALAAFETIVARPLVAGA